MNKLHLAALAIGSTIQTVAQTTTYPIGATVANFTTLDTDGQFHTLYDLTAAGKTVMLDFFFYNCVPCQEYAPSYSELYETYGCNQGGLICFSVNAGIDPDELAEQFAVDFGGPFQHPPTIGQFNGGLLTDAFGVESFPTLCVIAPDNTMWNDNVWPVDLGSLVGNFPDGTSIQPMSCSVNTAVNELVNIRIDLVDNGRSLLIQRTADHGTQCTIDLLDATGRSVRSWGTLSSPADGRLSLQLPELAHGTYLVRCASVGSVHVQKLMLR